MAKTPRQKNRQNAKAVIKVIRCLDKNDRDPVQEWLEEMMDKKQEPPSGTQEPDTAHSHSQRIFKIVGKRCIVHYMFPQGSHPVTSAA